MKQFNNYARHQLLGRLLLPFCILIILNLLLYYWSSENSVKIVVFIISLTGVVCTLLAVIFYPRFMNIKIQTLRYDDHLYEMIAKYEGWLQTINQRITVAEDASLSHFLIGKKKKHQPERTAKLWEDARQNKASILRSYQQDKQEAENKLNFYREEKKETEKMLTQYLAL